MKKTILLILLLTGLAALTYYLLKQNNKSTISDVDRNFPYTEIEDIQAVYISKRNGEINQLKRKDDYWMINDKHRANDNSVKNLLEVISKIKMQSIPPKAAYENIIKSVVEVGIKVELVHKNGKIVRSYYIGGVTNDESGSYFLMDGAKQPFVMSLPYGHVNVRHRFDLTTEQWRDRYLFRIPKEHIQSVQIDYPRAKSASFALTKENKDWKLQSLSGLQNGNGNPIHVKRFLEAFNAIGAEGFENKNLKKQEIINLVPFAQIQINLDNGEQITTNYYPIEKETGEVNLSPEFLSKNDLFRFYVGHSSGDLYMAQIQQIEPVLYQYQDFFTK